jgi:hypothetical protein
MHAARKAATDKVHHLVVDDFFADPHHSGSEVA